MGKRKDNKLGFTLVETLIYVAIIGTVITSFIAFSMSVTSARNKNFASQEVHANARSALRLISDKIKGASAVVSPLPGNSGNSLELDMPGAGGNVLFSISSGVLYITEGLSPAAPITSDETEISDLQFDNVALAGDKESIKINLSLGFRADTGVDFSYFQDLQTTASIR